MLKTKELDQQAQNQVIAKELAKAENLKQERKYGSALNMMHDIAYRYRDVRSVDIKYAELLEICKEYEKALGLYRYIHEQTQQGGGKTEIDILIGIGNCQIHLDKFDHARTLLEELKVLAPKHPAILTGLASCYRHADNLAEAEKLVQAALQVEPTHRYALHEKAQILIAQGDEAQALILLEENLHRQDVLGDSIDLWLNTLDKANKNRHAQDVLETLVKEHPDMVEFVFGYAVLANQAGEISLARPAYQRSMELSPNNPRIIYELGVLERTAGNLEESQRLIGEALVLKPDNPSAIRTYNSDIKISYGDDNFKRLSYVAAKFTEFDKVEQLHLHYALAKAHEDVDDLDTAFRHYGIAGEKCRKDLEYSDKEAAKMSDIIPKVVTKSRLAETLQSGYKSETPVFILGMPRSGTSLMEQILSAHPEIFGAGELKILTGVLENLHIAQNRVQMNEKDPVFDYDLNATWDMRGEHYVERLMKLADKPHKRIVDKMPGNFNFVGMIHAILPNAKIIHSRRHPVETCLSCYRIHFAEGHQWSYNLRELGQFYKRYWNLMKYWREEFPGVMYEVRYEDNVADVEGQSKKLIDYLGLEWNENCLNFYNVDRPVKTASVIQVRKPIYTTSTNRWRKYEKYLGPLLEELGDIVPEYEAEIAHLAPKK